MENKEIVQLDIVTVFLESKVEQELYLHLPKEFGLANNGNVILNSNRIELEVSVTVRLNRSFYGLKQAGHNWDNILESYFTKEMCIRACKFEAGMYTTPSRATIIAWVNNILLIGSVEEVESVHSAIELSFTIKDLGNIKSFLSMLVERDRGRRNIYLSPRVYLNKVLKRFWIDKCIGYTTPMDVKAKLHSKREGQEVTDKVQYQEAVRSRA